MPVRDFDVGLFLLTFFVIYGGFHFYLFLKVRAAFAPGAVAFACESTLCCYRVATEAGQTPAR